MLRKCMDFDENLTLSRYTVTVDKTGSIETLHAVRPNNAADENKQEAKNVVFRLVPKLAKFVKRAASRNASPVLTWFVSVFFKLLLMVSPILGVLLITTYRCQIRLRMRNFRK